MSEFYLKTWKNSLKEAQMALESFQNSEEFQKCIEFSKILIQAYEKNSTVFSCGNGGSYCDVSHFAEELTGRYRKDRRPFPALVLGDPSHITCVSNDYGFEFIFSRSIEAFGKPGDVLLGLSTSGNSKNIIRAFEAAKEKKMTTIALLGKTGGVLKDMSDLAILVPGSTSDRIQELHIKLLHIVIETIERHFFPKHYEIN